jgi:hypothetical protein
MYFCMENPWLVTASPGTVGKTLARVIAQPVVELAPTPITITGHLLTVKRMCGAAVGQNEAVHSELRG